MKRNILNDHWNKKNQVVTLEAACFVLNVKRAQNISLGILIFINFTSNIINKNEFLKIYGLKINYSKTSQQSIEKNENTVMLCYSTDHYVMSWCPVLLRSFRGRCHLKRDTENKSSKNDRAENHKLIVYIPTDYCTLK